MNSAVVFVFPSFRRWLAVLAVLIRVPAVGIGKDVSHPAAQPLADVLEKSFVWH